MAEWETWAFKGGVWIGLLVGSAAHFLTGINKMPAALQGILTTSIGGFITVQGIAGALGLYAAYRLLWK